MYIHSVDLLAHKLLFFPTSGIHKKRDLVTKLYIQHVKEAVPNKLLPSLMRELFPETNRQKNR